MIYDDDICENNHGGNTQSVEAFRSLSREERLASQRRILSLALARGAYGITCDEAEMELGMLNQSCSPRFSELKRDGKLIPNGLRRKTKSGRNAAVLVLERFAPL